MMNNKPDHFCPHCNSTFVAYVKNTLNAAGFCPPHSWYCFACSTPFDEIEEGIVMTLDEVTREYEEARNQSLQAYATWDKIRMHIHTCQIMGLPEEFSVEDMHQAEEVCHQANRKFEGLRRTLAGARREALKQAVEAKQPVKVEACPFCEIKIDLDDLLWSMMREAVDRPVRLYEEAGKLFVCVCDE